MSHASSVDHPSQHDPYRPARSRRSRHRGPAGRKGRRTLLVLVAGVSAALVVPSPAIAAGTPLVGLAEKCATASGSNSADGTRVVLASCDGRSAQSWIKPGNGILTVLGRCLDVKFGGTARGTAIQLWSCNGTGAQQWVSSGKNLKNPQSGLCLDVTGNNSTSGTPLQLWTCVSGQANQSWSGGAATADPAASGWERDFFDGFADIDSTWGKYGYGRQAPGHGGMGLYDPANVYASNGVLNMRTRFVNGVWTSAGISSGKGYSAYQGKWEVRARFDRAKGLGYAFLLYPDDGSWPPEMDIIEGHPDGPTMMSTFHWGATNNQIQQRHMVYDMNAWHTYGVIMQPGKITYTFDGVAWASFGSAFVPRKKMWIGIQTAARHCPDTYECVPGNVPNALTPSSSAIQIDWIAHYSPA